MSKLWFYHGTIKQINELALSKVRDLCYTSCERAKECIASTKLKNKQMKKKNMHGGYMLNVIKKTLHIIFIE